MSTCQFLMVILVGKVGVVLTPSINILFLPFGYKAGQKYKLQFQFIIYLFNTFIPLPLPQVILCHCPSVKFSVSVKIKTENGNFCAKRVKWPVLSFPKYSANENENQGKH